MKRPLVVLVGGSQGPWQSWAARELNRAVAPEVIETATLPLELVYEYLQVADVVVCWCGSGADVHYLHDWILAGNILGLPTKVVFGVSTETDHPMAESLRTLVAARGLYCPNELLPVLSIAGEHCRNVRSGH